MKRQAQNKQEKLEIVRQLRAKKEISINNTKNETMVNEEKNEANKNLDGFFDEFGKQTEEKQASDFMEQESFESPINNDFEEAYQPTEKVNEINTPGDIARADKLLSPETTADIYIGIFDNLQTAILSRLHYWKLHKKIGVNKLKTDEEKLEYSRLEQICSEVEDGLQQVVNLDISDRAKIRIMNRTLKKVNELPFTDAEYDQLNESLVLIIKDMPSYQLPPSLGLGLSFAQVMLPRIMDIVLD